MAGSVLVSSWSTQQRLSSYSALSVPKARVENQALRLRAWGLPHRPLGSSFLTAQIIIKPQIRQVTSRLISAAVAIYFKIEISGLGLVAVAVAVAVAVGVAVAVAEQ